LRVSSVVNEPNSPQPGSKLQFSRCLLERKKRPR
jgi:hypothetical protein